MRYLLIDGSNLACRCSFANSALRNSDNIPTGVHYGFMQSLIGLKQKFSDYQFLVVWDGKSKRRVLEANNGVKANIVPEGYKENRKRGEELPQELKDFYAQAPFLKRGIGQTGIPQIQLNDFEADDIVASYCNLLKNDNEIICMTSDSDYIQLLDKNVKIWDGMKQREITRESWETENGLKVEQYLDVAALMGDNSDNIFGVPSVGEKTAIKEIKEHGTWQNVIAAHEKEYADARTKYPDLHTLQDGTDWKKIFEDKLQTIKTDPEKENSRLKYPEITWGIPYTGVLLAFEQKKIKMPKTTLMILIFQERINLAYSLKQMDYILELPEIVPEKVDRDKLLEYFDYYGIETLKSAVVLF